MHKRSAILAGVGFLVMGIAVGYIVVSNRMASPAVSPTPMAAQYTNSQYGLSVALPTGWQGFTTVNDSYTITNISTGAAEGTGVVIKIRHPQWTSALPREDLPIMVFTPANWNRVIAEAIAVGAAPIPPSELARNSQYVLALPARYNFDYQLGWEEVQAIIDARSITAFEPATTTSGWETYSNTNLGFEVKIPPSWKGYHARQEGSVVWFSLPTTGLYAPSRDWLAITRYSIADWQKRSQEPPQVTILAQNDSYVFTYSTAQDYNPDMAAAVADYQKVLATFKLIQ